MPRLCHCGAAIPAGRLAVMPETRVCVECSTEPKRVCLPAYDHKTGGSFVAVDARDKEGVRRLVQQFRRTRWAG